MDGIGLADAIEMLRAEVLAAQTHAAGAAVQFPVQTLTVQLKVGLTKLADGKVSAIVAIVRDEMEADAVTQDTFIQAYLNLAKFEGRSELETWLTRIAINKSRDSLRRRRFISLFTTNDQGEEAFVMEPIDGRADPERARTRPARPRPFPHR